MNKKPERALTVLAVGANVWGKGATIDDAVRNALKHGGVTASNRPFIVYVTDDPGVYVDDMGYMTRKAGSLFQRIHVTRKGWRYGPADPPLPIERTSLA